jgi:hypothetical protein
MLIVANKPIMLSVISVIMQNASMLSIVVRLIKNDDPLK